MYIITYLSIITDVNKISWSSLAKIEKKYDYLSYMFNSIKPANKNHAVGVFLNLKKNRNHRISLNYYLVNKSN